MKSLRKKSFFSKRALLVGAACVLLAVIFAGGIMVGNGAIVIPGLSNTAKTPALDQQKSAKTGNTGNEPGPSGSKTNPDGQESKANVTYKPGEQQPATQPKVFISTFSQDPEAVYVGAIVEDATSGTCKLELTQGTTTVTAQTNVQFVTSYYACGSFKVAKSQLGAGQWTARVTVTTSGGGKATSDPKNLELAP